MTGNGIGFTVIPKLQITKKPQIVSLLDSKLSEQLKRKTGLNTKIGDSNSVHKMDPKTGHQDNVNGTTSPDSNGGASVFRTMPVHHKVPNLHHPQNPNFKLLLDQMRPIIPAKFKPHKHGATSANRQFLPLPNLEDVSQGPKLAKNLLEKMLKLLPTSGKLFPEKAKEIQIENQRLLNIVDAIIKSGKIPDTISKAIQSFGHLLRNPGQDFLTIDQSGILKTEELLLAMENLLPTIKAAFPKRSGEVGATRKMIKSLLGIIKTSGKLPKELSTLINAFATLLKPHQTSAWTSMRSALSTPRVAKKAPFCKIGDDCFVDVNHTMLTREIKKIALTLSAYLKDRMVEEKSGVTIDPQRRKVRYKTDALLTQSTKALAELHRGIMRNWHHILMILGNFAGEEPIGGLKKKDLRGRSIFH